MNAEPVDLARSSAAALGRAAAVVAAALDSIVIMDQTGAVVEFNPATERTFGWSRAEAVGRMLDELIIPEELRAAHRQGLRTYLDTGEGPVLGKRVELPAIRKDGSRLTVELIVVPTPGGAGYEFTGFVRDISELRETQERLRRSEERYDAIARNSNRALVLCRPNEGESVVVTGERVLGYPAGMALPDGFLSLVHEDDRELASAFLTDVGAGCRVPEDTLDLRLRAADGRYLLCEVMGEDFREHDAIGALMIRATDVTTDRARRRQLAETTLQMRTLLDKMSAGVVFEDAEHRIRVINQAMLDLFGVERPLDEFVGLAVPEAASAMTPYFADPEAFLRGVRAIMRAGREVLGEELLLADGRTLERDYVPLRSEDEVDAGHLWSYRDVTGRADEARRLEEQNRSLAELAALKNEFVAAVSHELRTPLTSVVSFSELLGEPSVGELNDEQRQFLDIVNRNAHKLLRLIDDLLLVARLEARTLPMSLGRVDTGALVDELVTEFQPRADAAGVRLTGMVQPDVAVTGDQVRLQQVVSNLVGNAVAYTPAGGTVEVTSRDESGSWVLEVADTGVGIPATELEGIFDAFQRASTSSQSSHHGTGLGLAVCRLIVDQHGGSLTARSQVGVGTTMTVRISTVVS